mmetsp:Transcript_12812/g.27791  ORF Transcript_12812/g.27791 Transcript_12812/m.27791 type:complete len:398 (+) Transcript_12812:356-1549(+)|eukprot:CAMPEP_0116918002 /NCGR_PEP_ID=MMETSP0467-20121206/19497_1 /TAXON_ID=283647 /ORGANISM="Mesodinium pulex, Strain SPMC105" /LENGTH=397 /DNA_ID=CAMNT_0004595239 /DNA_START=415 /DNA_END=1608 /DNA_ORIENTATION=+
MRFPAEAFMLQHFQGLLTDVVLQHFLVVTGIVIVLAARNEETLGLLAVLHPRVPQRADIEVGVQLLPAEVAVRLVEVGLLHELLREVQFESPQVALGVDFLVAAEQLQVVVSDALGAMRTGSRFLAQQRVGDVHEFVVLEDLHVVAYLFVADALTQDERLLVHERHVVRVRVRTNLRNLLVDLVPAADVARIYLVEFKKVGVGVHPVKRRLEFGFRHDAGVVLDVDVPVVAVVARADGRHRTLYFGWFVLHFGRIREARRVVVVVKESFLGSHVFELLQTQSVIELFDARPFALISQQRLFVQLRRQRGRLLPFLSVPLEPHSHFFDQERFEFESFVGTYLIGVESFFVGLRAVGVLVLRLCDEFLRVCVEADVFDDLGRDFLLVDVDVQCVVFVLI